MSLSFKRADQVRFQLTVEQQREIRVLYQNVADDIAKELEKPLRVPSDALRQEYLRGLQKQINQALADVGKVTEQTIRGNAGKVAESVVGCNTDWLKSVGLPIGGAYSWVPQDIVTSVATGQIYEGPWSLSGAIWSDVQNQQSDIQKIIAQGIAENKSAFDIGKDLEKYVDPSAVKPWDWSKVYPGVRRVIDYNAQRLARTMVSHAYQQAFVRTTQKNPFVTKYKWEASNSDRVCELCQERDGKLFSKDELPLDHPNGMCTFTAVIEDSMDQVADRLTDWANGADDPDLESWAKDIYGDRWGEPTQKQQSYKYHATTRTAISGIIEKGLKPNKGHLGRGVYFAQSPTDALEWTTTTSTAGKTILRVPEDILKSLGYEEYTAAESGYGMAEGLVDAKIPFDKIEIKVGENEWWSLARYAQNYENTVYNRLSSAAQKRVDKQRDKEIEEWLKSRIKKG